MEFSPDSAFKHLFDCIQAAWEHEVSDLHFSAGTAPGCRKARSFLSIDQVVKSTGSSADSHKRLLSEKVDSRFFECLLKYWQERKVIAEFGDYAFIQIAIDGDMYWRARVELVPYAYANGMSRPGSLFGLEVRIFPHTPIDFADLPYPQEFFSAIRDRPSGIVLVGGLASSGRSTTLASLVIRLASETPGLSIGTLEAPIEYILRAQAIDRTCRVLQTEVPRTRDGWFHGLNSLNRRDFNAVMVSEVVSTLPSGEMLDLSDGLLQLSGNGARVFSTIPAADFWEAFRRFTHRSDAAARKVAMESAVRHMTGIMIQQLVPIVEGGYVFPELHCGCMLFNDSVRSQLLAAMSLNDERRVRDIFRTFNMNDNGEGCLSFVSSSEKLVRLGISPAKLFLGVGTFNEG